MSPLRPPRPPSVRDKSRHRAACSRRQGSSAAAAALTRVHRCRYPRGSESHVGQQPLGAGTGPARMPRPLCEARGSPTRPGPAAPGRAEPRRRLSLASFRASQAGRAQRLALRPLSPLLSGPRSPPAAPRSLFSAGLVFFLVSFPFLETLVSSRCFWRVPRFFSAGPAGLRFSPPPIFSLPLTIIPDASLQACSFIPFSGPALICLSFSISSLDDLLLGDVFFARRDQKVKETKVSPAPPVALGREAGGGGDAE